MRRDSAIRRWHEAGGRLGASAEERRAKPDLYPYFNAKVDSPLNYSSLFYALILLGCWVFMGYAVVRFMSVRPPAVRTIHQTATAHYAALTATLMPSSTPLLVAEFEKEPRLLGAAAPPILATLPAQGDSPLLLPTATATLSPTPTLTPTWTPSPTPTLTPVCERCTTLAVRVRLGFFYPPLGGSHCPVGMETCEGLPLADGSSWFLEQGRVAACPDHFPLGAFVEVAAVGVYRCAQRLPLARCDYTTQVCDVLVLSPGLVVTDWRAVYEAKLWYR